MTTVAAPPASFSGSARAIGRLAVPLAGTQLAQVAVGTISMMLLGSLGAVELAGGGLGMMLFNLARTMGVGLTTGTANLIARADARSENESVSRLAGAGGAIATVAGVTFALLLVGASPLLVYCGQDPEVVRLATRFLMAATIGLVPCFWFNVQRNVAVGLGKPGPVLFITVVSIAVHACVAIPLSRGLFGLPALGALGVAIAQTLTHTTTCLLLAASLRRVERTRIHWSRPQRAQVSETLSLGIPTALAYGSEAGFFTVVGLLVGTFGATALAAHNVVNHVVYIVFMLAVGLSHGTSVVASRARAVGDAQALRRCGHTGLTIGALVAVVLGVLEMGAPSFVLWPFMRGTEDAAFLSLAKSMLAIAVCFQAFDCAQNVAGALLRALHKPRVTLVMTLIGYWGVGLPAAWLLGRLHGPLGVWWGLCIGLAATATLLVVYFEKATRHADHL
jgi:MATE family multidrug resistance protein